MSRSVDSKPVTFGPFTDGFYETGNQVHGWVMRQAQECFRQEAARKATISDRAAFEAYRAEKRGVFLASLGGLPQERCPLKVRGCGTLRRNGYTVRKLLYRTLPGFYVAANLYVPEQAPAPAPGVLVGCGHAGEGKAAPLYQQVCIRLVRAGFVVLIIDSPSHGEMLQCVEADTGRALAGWNTREHSHLQLSASIVAHNIARYFVWNAVRALELLCDLAEVDEDRIGMTGNSGGGWLTQCVMMTDGRLKAAMPCCSVTTRESYLDTGIRAYDGEQNLFGAITEGLDYEDFLACFAPRPLRVGAAEYDYFCIEGVMRAVRRARRLYTVCGAEDSIDLVVAEDRSHGYSPPLQRACVEWFIEHLGGCPDPQEEDPAPESPESLQCTGSGQVMTELAGARSIVDLNFEAWNETRRRAKRQGALTRQKLRQRLNLPDAEEPLCVRRTWRQESETRVTERVFFFSEPDILVTAVLYRPKGPPTAAVLLLIPDGSEGQAPHADRIGALVAQGKVVMVFDTRGTGAVRMRRRNTGEGLAFRSTEFRVANDHFQLGTSIAARRAYDVLRALEYLRRQSGSEARAVHLIAHGAPAVWGLLAAAVDGGLASCSFTGLPETWAEAFRPQPPEPERLSEPLIAPELRGEFDVPDLLRLAGC